MQKPPRKASPFLTAPLCALLGCEGHTGAGAVRICDGEKCYRRERPPLPALLLRSHPKPYLRARGRFAAFPKKSSSSKRGRARKAAESRGTPANNARARPAPPYHNRRPRRGRSGPWDGRAPYKKRQNFNKFRGIGAAKCPKTADPRAGERRGPVGCSLTWTHKPALRRAMENEKAARRGQRPVLVTPKDETGLVAEVAKKRSREKLPLSWKSKPGVLAGALAGRSSERGVGGSRKGNL